METGWTIRQHDALEKVGVVSDVGVKGTTDKFAEYSKECQSHRGYRSKCGPLLFNAGFGR